MHDIPVVQVAHVAPFAPHALLPLPASHVEPLQQPAQVVAHEPPAGGASWLAPPP
jgi:hypothetical protein